MCKLTQVNLQGIVGPHKYVGNIHRWVQSSRHPEEKPAIGTYNPSLLIRSEMNRSGKISLKRGGGIKGMNGIG